MDFVLDLIIFIYNHIKPIGIVCDTIYNRIAPACGIPIDRDFLHWFLSFISIAVSIRSCDCIQACSIIPDKKGITNFAGKTVDNDAIESDCEVSRILIEAVVVNPGTQFHNVAVYRRCAYHIVAA